MDKKKENPNMNPNIKTCMNCGRKVILDEDKFVLLGTYNGENTLDESYFHFKCWVEYFKDCMSKKIKSFGMRAIQNMKGLIPV